jgi:iron complex transport system ATP-binding protein
MSSHLLEVTGLRCGYGRKNTVEIVRGASFSLDVDEFVCIIGANGCGKTTLLKAVMGLLPVIGGRVSVQGMDIISMSERERAQRFAYIPQAHTPPFPFAVADVVMMGRTPYINRLARTTETDRLVAYQALELLGITHLSDTAYTRLSGGQQQLVLIARALTQQADILVMDEPTASLDFGNQQLVLSRMRRLSRMGKAVLMVTHDPDHALMCADKVIVMEKGTVIASGPPADCISSEMMQRIYRTTVCVLDVAVSEQRSERVCIPLLD